MQDIAVVLEKMIHLLHGLYGITPFLVAELGTAASLGVHLENG